MKVMVIVKATKETETGAAQFENLIAEMGKLNELLSASGVLVSMECLFPSSKGVRLRASGTNRDVINGPFSDPKDLVAGFWIWQVKSMGDAVEWAKRCATPMLARSEIEIRQVFEVGSVSPPIKSEVLEKEASARAEALGLGSPRFENGHELLIAGLKQSYMFMSRVNIPSHWQRFRPQIERIPDRVGQTCFGVCSSYKPDGGFEYLSGIQVSQTQGVPDEFTVERIPASRYAIFVHSDHVSSMPDTIGKIFNKWLPESGLKAAGTPCFERYTEQFNPQTGMGGMEIWVPIQS